MELMEKQGFKQTEVGLIPNDWIVLPQKDAVKYINGRAYSINEWESSGIPVVRLQNLTQRGGRFYYSNLNLPEYQYMYKGDLIFMWSASFGPYIWWGDKAIFHYHIWKIECNNKITDKQFYYHKLVQLTEELKKGTSGSTMLHLTKDSMEKYLFALPPSLEEQKAIATALSDVDELIANLEKLITKKKAIKQGAMQQLLTPPHKGGKRLEGHTGEWEEKTVGEIADYKNGTAHENCVVENGKFIIVNSKFVSTEGKVAKFSNKNLAPVNKGEILMVLSDIPNGKAIAKCFYVEQDNKYTLNQRICSFKTEKVNPRFLYLLLNRNPYYLLFDDGVKQTNLRNQDVLSCPICIPTSKKEQEQISTIIFDLQKDIELAIRKKEKYQSVKQGMMQELLTGKTRLV